MSRTNGAAGPEICAPSPEDPGDAGLLACSRALQAWAPEKLAAWKTSPEFARAGVLCKSDAADYGGETRLKAAIASCVTDFDRTYETTALRGRQLTEVELEERQGKKPPPAPPAPESYGYRLCPWCRGTLKEGRGEPCRCTKASAHPGWELFIIPNVKGGGHDGTR